MPVNHDRAPRTAAALQSASPVPVDAEPPLVQLSRREAQVLHLVSEGLGNQEIADLLYLSINSVKTYIRSAYRKLGVSSRAQAVAWGVQHGFPVDAER